MSQEIARRNQGVQRGPAAEVRTRAASLLAERYDEVMRMMTYVRWHEEDVSSIVPSLWANRKRRNDSPVPDAPVPDAPDAPNDPEPIVADDPATPAEPALDPTAPGGPFRP